MAATRRVLSVKGIVRDIPVGTNGSPRFCRPQVQFGQKISLGDRYRDLLREVEVLMIVEDSEIFAKARVSPLDKLPLNARGEEFFSPLAVEGVGHVVGIHGPFVQGKSYLAGVLTNILVVVVH